MMDAPLHIYGVELGLIGKLEAVCPHCESSLPKFPVRKTACRACGGINYVRTRPFDRKRVLVTASEAEEVEAMWSALKRLRDAIGMDPSFTAGKEAATALRQPKLSSTSLDWERLLDEALNKVRHHLGARQVGLLRNAVSVLAEISFACGKRDDALRLGTLVLALDNAQGFNPPRAGLVPGMLRRVASYIDDPDWADILMKARESSAVVAGLGGRSNPAAVTSALKATYAAARSQSVRTLAANCGEGR
ncbi:MAG: hypothetical protein KIS81_00825 [Maricaulaceae bacterium]|nr:hypothetical protein [Maricaulaceae bacterium]